MTHWTFADGHAPRRVRVSGRVSCSTVEGLHEACLQGLGISMHASWHVADDLGAGRLVEIALDRAPYAPQISALYPTTTMVAPKVSVFLQSLTAALEANR